MIYPELYWKAALFYGAGVLGFWVVMWKVTSYIPWRPLRWWLVWLFLCVVLTPWHGTDPVSYYAPAIIVAAFDFLDVGPTLALEILKPMGFALLVGTVVIVLLAVRLKIKAIKESDSESEAVPQERTLIESD